MLTFYKMIDNNINNLTIEYIKELKTIYDDMVKMGIIVKYEEKYHYEVLSLVCQYVEDIEIIRYITEEFNIWSKNEIKNSFMNAVKSGHIGVVKYLTNSLLLNLSNDYDIKTLYIDAFSTACLYGYIDICKYIYEEFGLCKDDIQNESYDALYGACYSGKLEIVKYLIEEIVFTKDDVICYDNDALRQSCNEGHIEVVRYLKDKFGFTKEDIINMRCNDICTTVCQEYHYEMIEYLIEEFGFTCDEMIKYSSNDPKIIKFVKTFQYNDEQLMGLDIIKNIAITLNLDITIN